MSKPVVLIDMDGVVVDFVSFYIEITNRLFNRTHVHDDVTEWWVEKALKLNENEAKAVYAELSEPGVAFHMNPYPGAVEAIRQLREVAEVHFVTASFEENPTWERDRRRWIRKYFDQDMVKHTGFFHKKYRVHGDIFIDDKPEHVIAWTDKWPEECAILWAQPYNAISATVDFFKRNVVYTRDWDTVRAKVESLR